MTEPKCKNCGTVLTGEYCAACGQQGGRGEPSLGVALAEIFDEAFTWDSRLWRTLSALILRPGLLTADFIAGRRARYVPPFRLYLIISFLTFLVLSVGSRLDTFNADVAGESAPLITIDVGEESVSSENGNAVQIGIADEDSPDWLKNLESRMESNITRLEGESSSFIDELLDYLPQLMFLMLPLFALVIQVLYLFSGYYYLQHLVFGLNFHSFAFLLYLLGQALALFTESMSSIILLVLFLYLPLSLRRVYGSSVAGALAKSIAVILIYGSMLVMGFVFISMLALALM
ncbi:MAG: DUF3667 domain-containing protein [Halieaceae bacterium]